ncbi:uncharacterized protein V6R79_014422 [Siganus canaliculatus]
MSKGADCSDSSTKLGQDCPDRLPIRAATLSTDLNTVCSSPVRAVHRSTVTDTHSQSRETKEAAGLPIIATHQCTNRSEVLVSLTDARLNKDGAICMSGSVLVIVGPKGTSECGAKSGEEEEESRSTKERERERERLYSSKMEDSFDCDCGELEPPDH